MFVHTFVADLAVNAFDVSVLDGLARLDEVPLDTPRRDAQASRALPANSGPLSDREEL